MDIQNIQVCYSIGRLMQMLRQTKFGGERCGPFKRRCAVVCFSIDQSAAAAARGCYVVGRPFGEKLIFSQNAYDRQTFTRRDGEGKASLCISRHKGKGRESPSTQKYGRGLGVLQEWW